MGLEQFPVALSLGGRRSNTYCKINPDGCIEANLDLQYLQGIGTYIPTIMSYDTNNDFIVAWLTQLLSTPSPPLVISVSYGALESYISNTMLTTFENTIQQLLAMGVTVVSGSGDDGVGGHDVRHDASKCNYNPLWPTTSQYVLSVGATQGPESGGLEIACSSITGGIITTGGGFSDKFSRPSYQDDAVQEYFSRLTAGTIGIPSAGYNVNGRGYPDVSVLGYNYLIINGKRTKKEKNWKKKIKLNE